MAIPATESGRAPRARRFDPERRDHILRTALDVIADAGLGGMTQRLVAAAADVPLGSVTYHFPSRDDLVRGAFARFIEDQNEVFGHLFDAVSSRDELLEVLVGLVDGGPSRGRAGVLGFELHLAALRNPRVRELTTAWTAASRAVLARMMAPAVAADLDAYLEGLILHALVAPAPVPPAVTRDSISRFLGTVSLHPFGADA